MGKQWKQWETILGDSKITADGDCSYEIKRHLLLGREAMKNLDSILKSRDIIPLSTKVCLVKAMVFSVVMCMDGCELNHKENECRRIDTFELWCWRRLLRVPWTAKRSNQSILHIHWKDWCWSWISNTLAIWCEELTLEKTLMLGKIEGRGEWDNRGWDSWMASPTQWTWVGGRSKRW